ncbi:MAG: GNAT family N-acetyltransferase [Sphingobacteriales bacterium]
MEKQLTDLNFNLQPETLENDLIKLEILKENDFERLYRVASDPVIWEQHPEKERYKREVFQLFFDASLKSRGAFLVFDRKTNELIGSTRYHDYDPVNSRISIGYTFLTPKYWGGQYNKAMKELLLDHAFQKVEAVLFQIGSTNIPPQKSILKIGAAKVNEKDFDLNGMKMVVYEYEIKKQDWENNKTQ